MSKVSVARMENMVRFGVGAGLIKFWFVQARMLYLLIRVNCISPIKIVAKPSITIAGQPIIVIVQIKAKSVEAVCTFGRSCWKIENEGINILKTKGYNVDHNFGHGTLYLARALLILNLLAFLLHTALHFVDELYQFLRKALHTRMIFFNDIRALWRYHLFPAWQTLWLFMISSIEEDEIVPPHIAALLPNRDIKPSHKWPNSGTYPCRRMKRSRRLRASSIFS